MSFAAKKRKSADIVRFGFGEAISFSPSVSFTLMHVYMNTRIKVKLVFILNSQSNLEICVYVTNNILLLYGCIGTYKQYDGIYIFSKQNHLVFRTFPKMLLGIGCKDIGFAWKSIV